MGVGKDPGLRYFAIHPSVEKCFSLSSGVGKMKFHYCCPLWKTPFGHLMKQPTMTPPLTKSFQLRPYEADLLTFVTESRVALDLSSFVGQVTTAGRFSLGCFHLAHTKLMYPKNCLWTLEGPWTPCWEPRITEVECTQTTETLVGATKRRCKRTVVISKVVTGKFYCICFWIVASEIHLLCTRVESHKFCLQSWFSFNYLLDSYRGT